MRFYTGQLPLISSEIPSKLLWSRHRNPSGGGGDKSPKSEMATIVEK
jgi:hypothetical protein